MVLPAFDIPDELRTLVNHNLRGFVDDIRVCEDSHCFHDEIETVVFCISLCVQERPVLPLCVHFLAAYGGNTFLHDLGFFDAPGLIDLGGVHRHLVGARTYDIERTVFFSTAYIQVACECQLLAFTVFRHFREETGELDVIACDWIRWEDFAAFDIGEVFARGFVLHFEILGCDVADFTTVSDHVNFKDVLFNGGIHIAYVNWYAAQALLQNLVMNSRCVCGYACFAFRVGECSEHKSWNIAQNDAA